MTERTGPHHRAESEKARVGAIIVAAGESRRMQGVDKVFSPVAGIPLLAYSVEAFQNSPFVDEIVIVLNKTSVERGRKLVEARRWQKVSAVVQGGPRRQDSVFEGLCRLALCGWVIIHDGARPCITSELIGLGLAEARATGAAIAAVPVKDTIKMVGSDGTVIQTPERQMLWAAQTPQVFRLDVIREAHDRIRGDVTDDSLLVERLGHQVKVFMGSYENIKVTTPDDLPLIERILASRKGAAAP